MELVIGWNVIVKIVIAGVATYVLLPAFLILRDLLIWECVEKFLLTEDLRRMIRIRADAHWNLNNKTRLDRKIVMGESGISYFLEGKEVSKEDYDTNEMSIDHYHNLIEISAPAITWRHNLLVWVLKHYKFDKDANPIPKWQDAAMKRTKESS